MDRAQYLEKVSYANRFTNFIIHCIHNQVLLRCNGIGFDFYEWKQLSLLMFSTDSSHCTFAYK